MEIPCGKYYLRTILEHEAILPAFKGSTIRGLFGTALRRVVCALKQQECETCLLREKCVFHLVFETPDKSPQGRGAPSLHPFVIEPPPTDQTHFEKGELLDFQMMLFGWANDYFPYFVYAFKEMGAIGMGRKVGGRRAAFSLKQITSANVTVYDGDSGQITAEPVPSLRLAEPTGEMDRRQRLTVSLETPLRIKRKNRLHAELDFHVLVRAALRRITTLHEHFGSGELDLDYRGLVSRAMDVRTVDSQIRWVDWRRYSNRRQQGMLMGGLVGKITYEGRLGEHLPLIRFCETVHLGKATTFGLGKIRIVEDVPIP